MRDAKLAEKGIVITALEEDVQNWAFKVEKAEEEVEKVKEALEIMTEMKTEVRWL